MANEIGIDRIKEGLHLGFAFWKQTNDALKDGKFDLMDAIGFMDEILLISPLVANSKELLAQTLDLNTAEREEIYEWAKGEFPADTPDAVKAKVTAALDWLITTIIAYAAFKPTQAAPIKPPVK